MNKPSDETDFVAAPAPNEAVVKPPRARVEDAVDPDETVGEKLERKRDYLEGFLQKKPDGGELALATVAPFNELNPGPPLMLVDVLMVCPLNLLRSAKANTGSTTNNNIIFFISPLSHIHYLSQYKLHHQIE